MRASVFAAATTLIFFATLLGFGRLARAAGAPALQDSLQASGSDPLHPRRADDSSPAHGTPTLSGTPDAAGGSSASHAPAARQANTAGRRAWPEGTVVLPIENLEGLLLVPASVRGVQGRDSAGVLALDTGAGFLALDRNLAVWAGVSDSSAGDADGIGLTSRPLPRLALGELQLDQVKPVMTFDAGVVGAVTDRKILGLLGQRPIADRAIWIDFTHDEIALIPISASADSVGSRPGAEPSATRRIEASRAALAGVLRRDSKALAFHLAGDGKILVRATMGQSAPRAWKVPIMLVLDTGATKCVLFQPWLDERAPAWRHWKRVRGLTAPTLVGVSKASIALVPRLALETPDGSLSVRNLDVAVLKSELSDQLSRVVGQRVDGLLGVSFLDRFGVIIDFPNRVLWLAPDPTWKNPRPFEYCHVGLQLERRLSVLRVVGIAQGSPADRAGIRIGDELVEVDGSRVEPLDVGAVNHRLEGRPGTFVTIEMRRNGTPARYHLMRRRLL